MIRHTGANMETVRKRNRAAILKFINDHGPASRKDLADALGLTPAAVTQICTDLFCRRNSCGDRSQCEKQWGRT